LNSSYTYNVSYYYNEPDALAGNSNTINPAVPYIGATQTIYIRVSAVGSPACNTVIPQNLVVNPLPQATIASSDADNTICSNETATITVTPTNFLVADATYSWTLVGVGPLPSTTNAVTVTTTGTYECTVNLNGCTTVLSLPFTVNTLPNFTLTGTNLVKCANENAVLTVNPTNFNVNDPSFTYSWYLGPNLLPSVTGPTYTTPVYGNYSVIVSSQGCSTTQQINVTLDTTDIPINTNGECVGTSYKITASPISGSFNPQNVTYQWYYMDSPSGTLILGATQNVFDVTNYVNSSSISASSFPITFEVRVTTIPDGCEDTQQFVVQSAICSIPKGISPNGDGSNDSFDLRGLGVKELSIFNRYGTKVYGLSNYTNEWQGQSDKGDELPDGTYYFVIEQTSGETKSGWVYINR
jgi:gliding motility-associated-like protein